MGWVRAGSMIHVVEEYGNWFRFVEYRHPVDLNSVGGGYIEYWVAGGALGSEAEPDSLIAPRPVPAFQKATQAGDGDRPSPRRWQAGPAARHHPLREVPAAGTERRANHTHSGRPARIQGRAEGRDRICRSVELVSKACFDR